MENAPLQMENGSVETKLTGREGTVIDLDVAAEWTRNYRHKHPGETISQFFGKEILNQILLQPTCLGIRFYYAHDKPLSGWQRFIVSVSNFILHVFGNIQGDKRLVMTGSMANGEDLLPSGKSAAAAAVPIGAMLMGGAGGGVVADQALPCPGHPNCPQNALSR